MGDSVVWFSGQFGFCVDIPVTVAVEAGWWEVGRPLAERADPACTLKWPGGLLMFRFSQMILLLLLCSEVGCQGAKFWKKSDTTSRQSQVAVEQDKPESKKDFEKSRFSFAKFTNRKSAAADESSDEAEPLIDQQMDMLLQQGQQALEQNDLAGAQQAYREILLSEPTNAAANHGLAMAADLERRWKDAEYHYLQALKASPSDANILSDLGYSCLLQRREAEAARYLNQALAIDAKHENARVNLALLDLQQGRAEAAEQRLRELYGNTARATEMMAQLQYQASEAAAGVPQSLDSFDELSELPPGLSLDQIQEMARQERDAAMRRRVQENSGRSVPGWGAGAEQQSNQGWSGGQPDSGMPSMPPLDSQEAAQAGYRGQWPTGPANTRTASWNQMPAAQSGTPYGGAMGTTGNSYGYRSQQAIQPSSWVQPAPYAAGSGYRSGGLNRASETAGLQNRQVMPGSGVNSSSGLPRASTMNPGAGWGGSQQAGTRVGAPAVPMQTGSPIPIRSGMGAARGGQSYGNPAGMQIQGSQSASAGGWQQSAPVGPQAGLNGMEAGWGEELPVEGLNAGPGSLFPVYADNSRGAMANEGVMPVGFATDGVGANGVQQSVAAGGQPLNDAFYYGPPQSLLPGQELSDQMSLQAAERAAAQGGYEAWPAAVPAVTPMQAYDQQRNAIHQQFRGMQQGQRAVQRGIQ